MKTILTIACVLFCYNVFAQQEVLKKGKAAFVQQVSENDDVKDYTEDFKMQLNDWGYWKIVTDKKDADFIIDLNVDSHRGITLTSWGGQSIIVKARFHTKDDAKLFLTEEYSASPNGSNGFNAGQSSIKKLIRGLKNHFE